MKAFRVIDRIYTCLIGAVLTITILVVLLPQFAGFTPYTVISGSMEPKYAVGSLIYVHKTPSEEISTGDAVTFQMGGKTITHEVIGVNRSENTFTTKGIANENTKEGPFPYEDIIGKASDFSLPYMGYYLTWLSSDTGKIVLLCAVGVMALLMILEKIFSMDREKEKKNSAVN